MRKRSQDPEKTNVGADKVEAYKWVIADEPGEFALIEKAALNVDHSYQRYHTDPKVLEKARSWSWLACGALSIGRRSDGTLWVIDGQHRYLAACRRSDIKVLPCMVYESQGPEVEAIAFLNMTAGRKPMNAVEKFKARIVGKDPVALEIQALVEQSGRRVASNSDKHTVRCISNMTKHLEQRPEVFRRLWPLIVDVCRNERLSERIIEAFMYIESRLSGESLTDRRWRQRIMQVGFRELHDSMAKFSAAYAAGGNRVWALGVVEAINKGLRVRLSVDGLTISEAA